MADPKLKVELDGDSSGLFAALEKASKGIYDFSKNGEKDLSNLNSPFEKLGGAFSMLKGAIAGLAIFEVMKASVDAAVELGTEVRRLSSFFQIGSEQAGELAEALKRMGSNPEEFINMSAKMTKQIGKNTEQFEKYGITVKTVGEDGKEHYRKQIDILEDVGEKLNSIEGDTARTTAAQQLLGKGSAEAATYLMKLAAAAEDSKKNLAEMGVAIDYEKLKNESKEYKKTQADITQTFSIMKVVAGQELLPSLLDLSRFFSSILTPAAAGIAWGIKAITTAFWTLKLIIVEAVNFIQDFFFKAMAGASTIGKTLWALVHLDVKGAIQAAKDGKAELEQIDRDSKAVTLMNTEEHSEKMLKIWGDGLAKKKELEEKDGDGGVVTPKDDREKDQRIIDAMKALLEEKRKSRAAELGIDADYYQLSARETLDFWKGQEKIQRDSEKANSFVRAEVSASKKANLKETEALWKSDLEKQIAQNKNNYDEQISLAEIYLGRIETFHTKESKEYIDAQKKLEDIKNAAKESEKKFQEEKLNGERQHNTALLDLQIEEISIKRDRGLISDEQALREIAAINEKKYQAEKKAIEDRLKLQNLEKSERQKINNELIALADKHKKDQIKQNEELRKELDKKSPYAGMKKASDDYTKSAKDNAKNFGGYLSNVMNATENAISNALKGMITGQMSFGEAMKGIWSGIADAVLDAVTKMVAQWIVAAAAEAIFGTASKETGNTEANAALDTAAAETWAAYAGIPFVGPALALAQQALILTSYAASKGANKAATAFATGGMVSGPTLGLVGEAGKEYMVPEKDMNSLLPSLVATGASLYKSMADSQARTNRYAAQGASYTPSGSQVKSSTSNSGHVFNISTALGDKRELAKTIKSVLNGDTRIYGTA